MKKRGISHIEVVLAFLLFMGTLFTAFYFFNPLVERETSDLFLGDIASALEKGLSSEVITYSFAINDDQNNPFINGKKIGVKLGTFYPRSENMQVVATFNDALLKANLKDKGNDNEEDLYCLEKDIELGGEWVDEDFVYIFIGKELEQYDGAQGSSQFGCGGSQEDLADNLYIVGSFLNQSFISEEKAVVLAGNYDSNYMQAKESLNIPDNVDFTFKLDYPGIAQAIEPRNSNIPEDIEVVSKAERVQILKADGRSFIFGNLTTTIW